MIRRTADAWTSSASTSPRPNASSQGSDPTLVIAETIEAAQATVAGGVPQQRVWALVLPAERLFGDDGSELAKEISDAAGRIAGFLTDSESARGSVERAARNSRPRVEVFPPLAADRPCPQHTASPAAESPDDLHPAVVQLAQWRTLLDRLAGGESTDVPYSYWSERLRGGFARWVESRSGWGNVVSSGPDQPGPTGTPPPELAGWTSDAQLAAARRISQVVTSPGPSRPLRSVLLAGFDLKFARDLAERLDQRPDLRVTVDEWRALSRGTAHTSERLRTAESIFAEWARPSAAWYARHKRPGQFLAVRLHRYEIDTTYPQEIAIDQVDAVVSIAPLLGRRIRDELGWPAEKLVYIPNFLDVDWLDRPKLPAAQFAIGMVGIDRGNKRFDLALDLLAKVRREDPRFRLVVRSTMPWRNPYTWSDPDEREYTGRCFELIEQDPLLRDSVLFDQPGRDMSRWFRRIGHVLSTSDIEGCHTAVAEGMASAAVPVVRPWPGADEVYDREWIYTTLDEAATSLLESADATVWADRGARARAEVRRSHDPVAVVDGWADLLHGDLTAARKHFGQICDP